MIEWTKEIVVIVSILGIGLPAIAWIIHRGFICMNCRIDARFDKIHSELKEINNNVNSVHQRQE